MSINEIVEENSLDESGLEIGQIWRDCESVNNNPFKTDECKYQEIISIKEGWVKYRENDKTYTCKAGFIKLNAVCMNCR